MKWMFLALLATALPVKAVQQYNEATCILLKQEIASEKRKRRNSSSVYYSKTQKTFDTRCQNPVVAKQKKAIAPIVRHTNKPMATPAKAKPMNVTPRPIISKTKPIQVKPPQVSPMLILGKAVAPMFILLFLGLIALYYFKKKLPQIKGRIGESQVRKRLEKHLDESQYTILNDVTLPLQDGGTTQVDHIVVSNFGIFVIETKNMTGWIFGNEHQAKWTQTIHRSKYPFQNPLRQNYKHTKTLSTLLDMPHDKFHSVVVFTSNAQLKTKMPDNVGYLNDMLAHINSYTEEIIDHKLKLRTLKLLDIIRLKQGRKTNKQHVNYLEEQHNKYLKKLDV